MAWLIKSKSVKQSLFQTFFTSLVLAFCLFIFQTIILSFVLFINRQVKKDSLTKPYIANYMAGTQETKPNFHPYEPTTKRIVADSRLVDKLYHTGLKQNDTIYFRFDVGLFGINYQPTPFPDR